MRRTFRLLLVILLTTPLPFFAGCRRKVASEPTAVEPEQAAEVGLPEAMEVTAEQLLSSRLPPAESAQGWIRLFDGHTLFGWDIAGAANWRVEQGKIVVDAGDQSLLCTSLPWQDFELIVEFQAAATTNSGVFLRTPLQPEDPATDCYEVNIAPADNPYPTGSVVARQTADAAAGTPPGGEWQTLKMVLRNNRLQVSIGDQLVCDYTDDNPLPAGRIGLQHNAGRIEFRDVRLRPLGLESLLDEELSQWTRYPELPGDFSVTEQGWLRVRGGRTQLESKTSFDDFVLLAEYKLPTAEMNSGIFFRCIPGDQMMGYECQLSNAVLDENGLTPADCGTGGIFRRQDARVVAGEVNQWASVVLVAHRESMAAWVNGIQVSNWFDDRTPDPNPRKGRRLAAGTIMIQGHDPGTDALLKQIRIAPIAAATGETEDAQTD